MSESTITYKPVGKVALPSGVLIIGDASLAFHHLNNISLPEIEVGPVRESEGECKSIALGPETQLNLFVLTIAKKSRTILYRRFTSASKKGTKFH